MRLTLIHNPTAGSGGPSREELIGAFHDAGYRVSYRSIKSEAGVGDLADPGDLVVAAGGDGTIAEVATHLVGRGVPLGILPIGTANNVARSLGVRGTAAALVDALRAERLPRVPRVPWNVGVARAPWGERRFVEAAGVGLFARLLEAVRDAKRAGRTMGGDPIAAGRRLLRDVLHRSPARPVRVEADGEDLSGDHLLAEVLNVRAVGPRIELAPDAGRGDGHLALVLLGEAHRRPFDAYLAALLEGHEAVSPVPARRVRRVRLTWASGAGRLDDELWPSPPPAQGDGAGLRDACEVDIAVAAGRLEVLVPGGGADARRPAAP